MADRTASIAELDVEKALLGTLLRNPDAMDEAEGLEASLFTMGVHRDIFHAMLNLHSDGKTLDYGLVRAELRKSKSITGSDLAYLVDVEADGALATRALQTYIAILAEKRKLRELRALGDDLATRAMDQVDQASEIAADGSYALDVLLAETPRLEMPRLDEQSARAWQELEDHSSGAAKHYFSYGIDQLDALVGGLTKGEMTILGGRPGQGKSSGGNQLIARHCPGGTGIYLASPEMKASQNLRRLWAGVSGVPFYKIRRPERMTSAEKQRVHEASVVVAQWPLYMDESENVTVDDICLRAKAAKRKHGVEIVIVDYLQKLRFSSDSKSRFQEVGDAAKKLSNLAKKEDLAVLVLSSLTENGDKRRDDPPKLSDLRQSGDIQYEASTVLLLHRVHQGEDSEDLVDTGQIIIAKARSDESGIVNVRFDGNFLRFDSNQSRGKSWLSGAA